MNCPGCNAEMPEIEEGTEQPLRECAECGGVTVELADLKPLLLHHNLPGMESLGGRVVPDGETGQCGTCLIDLTLFESADRQDPLYYEACEECGCIFVDGGSLDEKLPLEQRIIAFFRQFGKPQKRPV